MSDKPFRNLSPQDFKGEKRIYNAVARACGGNIMEFKRAVEDAGGPEQFVRATRHLGKKSLPFVTAAYEQVSKEVLDRAMGLSDRLDEIERLSKPEPYHGGLIMPGWTLERRVERLEARVAEVERKLEELRQIVEAMPAAIKALLS